MKEKKYCGNCKHVDKTLNYCKTTNNRTYIHDLSTNGSILYIKCNYTGAYHNINDKNKCFNIHYKK